MVAVDQNNRDKMITIIADILEMSSEVLPLLKPLMDRDRKVAEAEKALEQGDFQTAMDLFEEVAPFCMELGDDRVSQDFHDKSQKIRTILRQSGGQSPKTPPAPKSPPVKKPAVIEESAESPMRKMQKALHFGRKRRKEPAEGKMHPHQ